MRPGFPTNGLSGGTVPSSLRRKRLADVIVERLRLHAQAVVVRSVRTQLLRVAADAIAIADRHVEHSVLAEVDAAGNVATGLPRVGDEDLFDVSERRSFQVAARDGERRSLRAQLRIRHVNELVVGELRMHRDEVQRVAPLPRRCRRCPHRLWFEDAVANQSKRAVLLCDQNRVRVGERDAPRMKESVGDGDDANLAALHVKNLRAGVARGRSLLRADGEGEQDDRHGLPHASREVSVHSASIRR